MANYHVFLCARNKKKALQVINEVKEKFSKKGKKSKGFLEFIGVCDLENFQSIKSYCSLLEKKKIQLNLVIMNAGVLAPPPVKNISSGRRQILLNFYHPVIMLELLKQKSIIDLKNPSRIVFTSSEAHRIGHRDIIAFDKGPKFELFEKSKYITYCSSKYCLNVFIREYSKSLKEDNITINCFHPGVVNTNLYQSVWYPLRVIVEFLLPIIGRSTKEGVDGLLYLSLSPKLEGVSGKYFVNRKIKDSPIKKKGDDIFFQNLMNNIKKVIKKFY